MEDSRSNTPAALGRRRRILAVLAATALIVSMVGVVPAFATEKSGAVPTLSSSEFDQWEDAADELDIKNYENADHEGSMYWVNRQTGAADMWANGFTGAGVDIALIDTGIAPVNGLRQKGKVVNGADLSFDSQVKGLQYLDAYGHGTHLAGIIAGRVDTARTLSKYDDANFVGVAPDARIVNVKVADAMGSTDVSQVIAAIDWVIDHRRDNGLNIRVITLAYGTDGTQSYKVDPLTHAVERAWQAGIVVVVAAGNDGNGVALRNPASDPFVIAVGASENTGRMGVIYDDAVTSFSNCGSDWRRPDIVAPGKSIVSLRNPGSVADTAYPEARVDDQYFLGSGTSQAAAVVSGSVALLLQQRPDLNPNQVKELLMDTARPLSNAKSICQGAGALNLKKAAGADTPSGKASSQSFTSATGTGSLEAARGTVHVYWRPSNTKSDPIALTGDVDIMGNKWTSYECKLATYCATKWRGGDFNGASWSGASWSGASWSGASWSGASWSGASWSGASWSGASWSGASWSGASWSGASWSGASWSGASWSGNAWSAEAWG